MSQILLHRKGESDILSFLVQLLILDIDIQFHFQGGMAVIFIDGIDAIPPVPVEYLHSNGF